MIVHPDASSITQVANALVEPGFGYSRGEIGEVSDLRDMLADESWCARKLLPDRLRTNVRFGSEAEVGAYPI